MEKEKYRQEAIFESLTFLLAEPVHEESIWGVDREDAHNRIHRNADPAELLGAALRERRITSTVLFCAD
jgi:hypothetical protein